MIRLLSAQVLEFPLRLRMPFHYGIVTVHQLRHAIVRIEAEIDGATTEGMAADHLAPKWFAKNPSNTIEDDEADLRSIIDRAIEAASEVSEPSVFSWWWSLYQQQKEYAEKNSIEPLLANFGASLLERAMIDAFCRLHSAPFHQALRQNAFGIDWSRCYPELAKQPWHELLPSQPLPHINVRHTVGMGDPLSQDDLQASKDPADGLPRSLEQCIQFYGLKEFKLKVGGKAEQDLERLKAIAKAIEAAGTQNPRFSLDANEQYASPAALRDFGEQVYQDPELERFFGGLMFIEQPFPRSQSLNFKGDALSDCWPRKVPLIIDESDGGWHDLPRALQQGYSGVSHKNCKGVFKGLRNLCLTKLQQHGHTRGRPPLTTGEDLSNIPPIALLQDLAVQAAFGNASVERNGHHYFAGASMWSKEIRAALAAHHPDLFNTADQDNPRLEIVHGEVGLSSINQAPFGLKPWLTQIQPRNG